MENWFVIKPCKRPVAPPPPPPCFKDGGEKMFMLIPASLSVFFTHLTNVSFDGTLNGLFRVMNNEVMLPCVVLLLLSIALNSSVEKLSNNLDMHGILFGQYGIWVQKS